MQVRRTSPELLLTPDQKRCTREGTKIWVVITQTLGNTSIFLHTPSWQNEWKKVLSLELRGKKREI